MVALYSSWREKNSEVEILQEVLEDLPNKLGHIPNPKSLWHHPFTGSTSKIRETLKLENSSNKSYTLIFRKLKPITDLQGTDLLKVWWECVVCNRDIWRNGVHHCNISRNNLMYYTDKDGKLIGVLNDCDLASLATSPGPLGNERTGTIPFMALDLLTAKAICGEVEHLYRHDLESFVWVLVWVCMRYKNGALRGKSRKLDGWARADAMQCLGTKSAFIIRYLYQDLPREIDMECWTVACDGLWALNLERLRWKDRKREDRFGRAGFREEEKVGGGFELKDDVIFARFEEDVVKASPTLFA